MGMKALDKLVQHRGICKRYVISEGPVALTLLVPVSISPIFRIKVVRISTNFSVLFIQISQSLSLSQIGGLMCVH